MNAQEFTAMTREHRAEVIREHGPGAAISMLTLARSNPCKGIWGDFQSLDREDREILLTCFGAEPIITALKLGQIDAEWRT